MPNNSRLVLEPGNQWTDSVAPFFVIPGWWRRFLYRVLKPREVVVYEYVCALMDKNAIAYPSVQQIVNDCGVQSNLTVTRALERLVELGFLIRSSTKARGRLAHGRIIYQRPTPHSTLLELLQHPDSTIQLDGELFVGGVRTETSASSDSAVAAGLKNLLDLDDFRIYASAPSELKHRVLVFLLKKRQLELLAEAASEIADTDSPAALQKWQKAIPPELHDELYVKSKPKKRSI